MAARAVRLLVPSPDRRRVLGRPHGVAGWGLPVVAVGDDPWSADDLAAAERVIGAPVQPIGEVVPGTWQVEALGRIPAVGITWIGLEDAARLGPDAAALRQWASGEQG